MSGPTRPDGPVQAPRLLGRDVRSPQPAAAPGVERSELAGTAGLRLLVADVRTAAILLNEARYRTAERLFGADRNQANVITAVALLTLADATHDKLERLRRPHLPSASAAAMGAAGTRSALSMIAGPQAAEQPLFGTLVTIAILGGAAAPAARASVQQTRMVAHRMRVAFNRRYGHLVPQQERRSS